MNEIPKYKKRYFRFDYELTGNDTHDKVEMLLKFQRAVESYFFTEAKKALQLYP